MNHKHINISTLQLDLETEFVAKLKLITPYFESRMNGATAHQMQQASAEDQRYKLNYGISLGDMKMLAQAVKADDRIILSNADYDILWNTDIREAVLLALLIIPEDQVCVDRVMRWIDSIHTQEMAEMLPFLMSWKVNDGTEFVERAVSSYATASYLRRIAYTYTIGRLLQHGKMEKESISTYLECLSSCLPQEGASVAFLYRMLDHE